MRYPDKTIAPIDPPMPVIEPARQLHLHFLGVDPSDVAEILRHQADEYPRP